MKFRIVAYIRVETEINVLYNDKEEAIREMDELMNLQPENRYEVEEIEEEEAEPEYH